MDNIPDFLEERPHMPDVFFPPSIPLSQTTEYLNRLALIHFIQGAPNHDILMRIRNYVAYISGWQNNFYEIRRASIAPAVLICPGQGNRDGLARERPYRLQLAPNHILEFTITAWHHQVGLAYDPMQFEALIILRAPPLQVWSPLHIPTLVSSFAYVVQVHPYGLPEGQFQEITIHVHCVHPSLIPRHIMFHQGHRAAPFDVILRRWRPLQHGPPPPWNDGQHNRCQRLQEFHHQPSSSHSSANTPPLENASIDISQEYVIQTVVSSPHLRRSRWIQKSLLFPATLDPSKNLFWTPKISDPTPLAKSPSHLVAHPHTPAAIDPTTSIKSSLLDLATVIALLPHKNPLPSLFYWPPKTSFLPPCPTIIISYTAILSYSPPLLTAPHPNPSPDTSILPPSDQLNPPQYFNHFPVSLDMPQPLHHGPIHSNLCHDHIPSEIVPDATAPALRKHAPSPSTYVRRSPRLVARPPLPRPASRPKHSKPKTPKISLDLPGRHEALSHNQALSILQASGLTIDDDIQAQLLNALADQSSLPEPSTPLHASVPVYPTEDGLFI